MSVLTRRKFLQIVAASAGAAVTAPELLSRAAASASRALFPRGSRGVRHIVVLMMENRSFDHFLGWLPGADGRHDLTFVSAIDGHTYPNYPLAPDFQGCGYSDPDHSWEGFLVEHNYGRMDGFLQRPTSPGGFPGVKLAAANTFPIGFYTNLNADRSAKTLPDLAVIGPWARNTSPWTATSAPLRRDLSEPLLPARGTDRPGPQLRDALYPPHHLGPAVAR